MIRNLAALICLLLLVFTGCVKPKKQHSNTAIIEDEIHYSKYFEEERKYRVFLPPNYYTDSINYPVIYFFHGYGGRYNGPAEGEDSVDAETRYYDDFSGNVVRCGNDKLDNIAEFVKANKVIVVKWDGFVKEQYPRPYDIGPVKQDLQFTEYFKEFIAHIDSKYRTIPNRTGRAVSGLSMGGFMSLNIAARFPHLISSASFFCPAGAFLLGPREMQVYTPMKDMKQSFVGLPIRMHIGKNDFLRQYNYEIEEAFKDYDLFYESWHYGTNIFNGFHNAVNIKGQFDFHVRNFRMPVSKPEKWSHIDVFPDFDIWGYSIKSDRTKPGFTIIEEVNEKGFKLKTRKWLIDGPSIPEVNITMLTDSIYKANKTYEVASIQKPYLAVKKQKIKANAKGQLKINLSGQPTDVGIYTEGDEGFLSVSDFKLQPQMPRAGEIVKITPVLFNKGGKAVKNIDIELISSNENIEVLSDTLNIEQIAKNAVYTNGEFKLRCIDKNLRSAVLKIKVSYGELVDFFYIEVPFFNPENKLTNFQVADGRFFQQENDKAANCTFGKGNGNGIVEAGETISFLTRVENNPNYYGLKVYTTDRFVDTANSELKYNFRKDWTGAMRPTSEVKIEADCPSGHIIHFYGEFDYPNLGNIPRDNQAATSFIHRKKRVNFSVKVK